MRGEGEEVGELLAAQAVCCFGSIAPAMAWGWGWGDAGIRRYGG